MKMLWNNLKRGALLLFVLAGLGTFIIKTFYDIYAYTPKLQFSLSVNILIYSSLITLTTLILGYLSNKISLVVNIFFRRLGKEALLATNNGEIIYPMITAGEIRIGEIDYYVCYRTSTFWVLTMPAEFIKKSSPRLTLTERSAISALWSSAQYYNDQNNNSAKKS